MNIMQLRTIQTPVGDRYLKEALNASTPKDRSVKMAMYYSLLLADRKTPKLLRRLADLSEHVTAPRTTTDLILQNILPSVGCKVQGAILLSMPNELLDRILDSVLSDLASSGSPRNMENLSVLLVCRQLFNAGLRHILGKDLYVFAASEEGRFCEISDNLVFVGPASIPPLRIDTLRYGSYPVISCFLQTGGMIALSSLLKLSKLSISFDPLLFVKKVRVDILLPPLVPGLTPSPTRRVRWDDDEQQLTHPHLQPNSTLEEKASWLFADMTDGKADYHMGFLKELPFKDLHTLEIGFRNVHERDYIECWPLQAIWIGRYLRRINIRAMAKNIVFREFGHHALVVEEVLDKGLERLAEGLSERVYWL